tara:strand:+ start:42103 stop:43101 length:999 start_codon:yes stop_codon:yes gene_type:complete
MKINTPVKIAFYLSSFSVFLFFISFSFYKEHIPIYIFILILLMIGFFTYILIRNYIQKKINILYRIIQKQKNINESTLDIDQAEKEVSEWVLDRQSEINHLKDTEKFRREFLGNVSHELKTPIFNIQGYILTLLGGALEDSEINKKYLERSQKSVERMISIVEDLSNISNMESADVELSMSKFDIISTTLGVIDLLENKAAKNNLTVSFDKIYPPTYVIGNQGKIYQVLMNLIHNSIIYGKTGGRTLIKIFDVDSHFLIEVSDDGIGIETNDIDRLCERFYRVDSSRSIAKGGTGLGLSIVKHILDLHGQVLNIRSTIRRGSTFSFMLKKSE